MEYDFKNMSSEELSFLIHLTHAFANKRLFRGTANDIYKTLNRYIYDTQSLFVESISKKVIQVFYPNNKEYNKIVAIKKGISDIDGLIDRETLVVEVDNLDELKYATKVFKVLCCVAIKQDLRYIKDSSLKLFTMREEKDRWAELLTLDFKE